MIRSRVFLLIFVAILFISIDNSRAQFFEKAFGDVHSTIGVHFAVNSDHSIVVLGNYIDSVSYLSGYYLLKVDPSGNVLWKKNIPTVIGTYSNSIATLPNQNIVVLGTRSGPVYSAIAEVSVFDSSGNYITSAQYPPLNGWATSGVSLISTGDSALLFTFYTDGFISANYYSIYSLNSSLMVNWSDFTGFDGSLTGVHGLSVNTEKIVFTMAYYDLYYYSVNQLTRVTNVRKHNTAGQLLSDSIYQFNTVTTCISNTVDKGAILGGTHDTLQQRDAVLIRLDSVGNVIFARNYQIPLFHSMESVTQTQDSGFVFLATIKDSLLAGMNDMFILKTDASGDSLWSRSFGGIFDEQSLHLVTDENSLVLMASTSSFGSNHIYLAKTDSSGVIATEYAVISNGKYFCPGDTAELTLQPPPRPGATVVWSTGDTALSIKVNTTGNYTAVITDTSGIETSTPYCSLYFLQPTVSPFPTDTVQICRQTVIGDSSLPDPANSFQWLLNGTTLSTETSNKLIPQQTGLYQFVTLNYCSIDTSEVFVDSLFDLPVRPVVTAPMVGRVCTGDSLLLSTASQIDYTFQWYMSAGAIYTTISGATDSGYYATAQGNYLVQAIDANSCSTKSLPFLVLYDTNSEFINPNGPSTFCSGGEVLLTVSAGSNYLWSTGDTTQSILVRNTGRYYVSFVNQYGCPKVTDSVNITVLNNPTVFLGPDTTICYNDTLLLDAGVGFNGYLWSGATTGQYKMIFTIAPDTVEVFVSVIDTNGCTAADTVNVQFDACTGVESIYITVVPIFPNPVKAGEPCIIKERLMDRSQFEIFDGTGRVVHNYQMLTGSGLTVLKIPEKGYYFYRINKQGIGSIGGTLIVE